MVRSLQVRIPPAKRVLDLGCGSGWVLGEAQIEGSPFCVGMDKFWESLHSESPRPAGAARAPGRHIHFVQGDGLRLPFPDDAFDVIVGHVSMPYMNTRDALREVYRVLRPGGCFFFTFHSFYYFRRRFMASVSKRRWKDVLFMSYAAVNGFLNQMSLAQFPAPWNRARFETVNTPLGVSRTARRAGFILIAPEHAPDRIFFAVCARKPGHDGQGVLPAPGWSVYTPLAPCP
jgi:SAM-dependent methyltransferase